MFHFGFWGFVLAVVGGFAVAVLAWWVCIFARYSVSRLRKSDDAASKRYKTALRSGPFDLFEAVPSVWTAVVTFVKVMTNVITQLLPRCRFTVITQQLIVIAVAALPYINSLAFGALLDRLNGNRATSAIVLMEISLLAIVSTWWLMDLLEKKLTYSLDQHFREMFSSYFPRVREKCGMESFQSGDAFRTLAKAEQGEYFVKFFVVFSMSLIGGLFGSALGAITVLPNIAAEPRFLLGLTLLIYLFVRLHSAMQMSIFEDSNYKRIGEITTIKNSFGKKEYFKGLVAFGITSALIRRADRLAAAVFGPQRKLSWQLTPRETMALLVLIGACAFGGHLVIVGAMDGQIPIGKVAFLVGSMVALIRSLKSLIEGFGLQILGIQKMDNLTKYLRDPDAVIPPIGGELAFEANGPLGIEVDNLSYQYPGAKVFALRNLTCSVTPGSFLFVEGGNGVGKTTLDNLLQHLYRAPKGAIFFVTEDGRRFDVADLRSDFVRKVVRHLSQSTLEMKYTIRETLAMAGGIEESSQLARSRDIEARMWRSLRYARLHTRIRKFRNKLDETLQVFNDAREDLSGGQHRKLNIAMLFMAMLDGAKIVILDEPFTGVEPQDAKQILANFRDVAWQIRSTVLITTHAMSEIPPCASVLALFRVETAGELQQTEVEYGTHTELIASSPRYARYTGAFTDMSRWDQHTAAGVPD